MFWTTQRQLSLARTLLVTVLFFLLSATAANAYTIVMRDGRRVEIPNEFTVTNSTLTYEVGSGIQVTIQLANIDIPATERMNGQASGGLLRRSQVGLNRPSSSDRADQARSGSQRTITNQDLEAYRRARIQSERAYERRRKELGLPSVEEGRRELAEISERTQQQLLQMRSQELVSETYWRNRAASLRAEIAANEAQIDFVRRRLDEIPSTYSFGAFTTALPFGTVGISNLGLPFPLQQFPRRPNVFTSSVIGSRFGPRVGFQTGGTTSQVMVNRGQFRGIRSGRRLTPFPNATLLSLPFESLDYNLERSILANRLDELGLHRAGLQARWREMEEDARRAGAYPGWLRP